MTEKEHRMQWLSEQVSRVFVGVDTLDIDCAILLFTAHVRLRDTKVSRLGIVNRFRALNADTIIVSGDSGFVELRMLKFVKQVSKPSDILDNTLHGVGLCMSWGGGYFALKVAATREKNIRMRTKLG